MPAKISNIGLKASCVLEVANSLRNKAITTPDGVAIKIAPKATINVPFTSGNTPKLFGSNKGVHVVPKKNSAGETTVKKLKLSFKSINKTVTVVTNVMTTPTPNKYLTKVSFTEFTIYYLAKLVNFF